jgi:tetratricopeptide (TPR) repeat protein/predicted O-methyltransferase YrrM
MSHNTAVFQDVDLDAWKSNAPHIRHSKAGKSVAARTVAGQEFHCRFCGSPDLELSFVYPDRHGCATEIHRCRECQCLVPNYPLDMRPAALLERQTQSYGWGSALCENEARELSLGCDAVVGFYKSRLSPERGLVLEIGAGHGGLMDALRRAGYAVAGCEPSEPLVAQARKNYHFGENVLYCAEASEFVKQVGAAACNVQAVFLWHVLEYLPEPLTLLHALADLLNEDGLIIAQIPLLDREYIRAEHLFFLTEATVAYAAKGCGYSVEATNYDLERKFMAFVLRKTRHPCVDSLSAHRIDQKPAPISKLNTALPADSFNSANGVQKSDAKQLVQEAETSFRRGDLGEAREKLRAALAAQPGDADLLDMLGNIEWRMGNLEAAKDAFVRVAASRPGFAGVRLKIAAIAMALGRFDAAEPHLAAARALDPKAPEVLQLSGNLNLGRNRFAEAAQAFEALRETGTADVGSMLALVKCRFKMGELNAAYAICREALVLDPGNPMAMESLAIIENSRKKSPSPENSSTKLALNGANPQAQSPNMSTEQRPSLTGTEHRSLRFSQETHDRFYWHKHPNSDFVPPIYSFLEDEEWLLLDLWYRDTEMQRFIGECCVPFMSLLQGLVMGNRLRRIVQLGTYSGYSSLLLGFMFRRMGIKSGLFSADVDKATTDFAEKYVRLARLQDYVKLVLCDSRSPGLVAQTAEYFGGYKPQMVIIDSSHEKDQTVSELDLWYDALVPGGLIVLHDSSLFARRWDKTGKGGVNAAFDQWSALNPGVACFNIDCAASSDPSSPHFVYQDPNGVGLVYKRKDRR